MSHFDELRRRALQRMGRDSARADDPGREETLEELRIHQIELELQNQQLRESQLSLEGSRAALRELFDLAPVPYVVVHESGRLELGNLAFAELVGLPADNLFGSFVDRFVQVGQRALVLDHLRLVARTGQPRTWEGGMFTGDRHLQVFFSCRPERHLGRSRDPRLFLALVDITARREAERAQQRAFEAEQAARRAAESAEKAKSEFLANITHELRTPLTSIIGAVRLLREMPLLEEQEPLVQVLQSAAPALLGLVDNVVTVSLLDSGNLPHRSEPTRLRPLVEEAVRVVSIPARMSETEVVSEIGSDLPEVVVLDPAVVRQILVNLLGNAVKFTRRGQVRLRVSREEGRLVMQIRDTGIGFDPERTDVFGRFVQVDSSSTRQFGGSGLGLAICKGLVEQIGGSIDVASAPGRGSTFVVELPFRVPDAPAPDPVPAGPGSGSEEAGHGAEGEVSILVVDDDRDIRFVTRILLAKDGFEDVALASSGHEAVRSLERTAFGLVLLDLQMPGIDGRETLERIRALERDLGRTAAKVVAFTARRTGDDRPIDPPKGFDGILPKPFEPEDLVAAVRAFVRPSADIDPASTEREVCS